MDNIIGKIITAIYYTLLNGPHTIQEGLPSVDYFSIIVELDNGLKYKLNVDEVIPWADNKQLIPVNKNIQPTIEIDQYLNKEIKDIRKNEYNQCYLLLENDMVLYYSVDWGSGFEVVSLRDYLKKDGII